MLTDKRKHNCDDNLVKLSKLRNNQNFLLRPPAQLYYSLSQLRAFPNQGFFADSEFYIPSSHRLPVLQPDLTALACKQAAQMISQVDLFINVTRA